MTVSKKLDSHGRITVPKALRLKYGWKSGMSVDVGMEEDGTLVVRPHSPTCRFCGAYQNIHRFKDIYICTDCADELKGSIL